MDPAETDSVLRPASVCSTSQRELHKSHAGLCSVLTGAWQLVCGSAYECHPTPLFPHDCCVIAALLKHCNLKPQHNSCRGSSGTAQDAIGGWGGIFFSGDRKTPDACCYALRSFNPSSQFTEGSLMPGRDLWVSIWRFTFLKAPSFKSSFFPNLSFALFSSVSISVAIEWAKKNSPKSKIIV